MERMGMMKAIGVMGMIGMLFCACSDWNDMGTETIPTSVKAETQTTDEVSIAFNSEVVSSKLPTRADVSLVRLGETRLQPTATSNYYVGIFGVHTGQYTWTELTTAYMAKYAEYTARVGAANATVGGYQASDEFETFKTTDKGKAYTPALLYNAKATVNADGSLSYAPERFWPNNKLTSDATKHEYCTFWAYYPYNPSAEIGDYGITLIPENIGEGTGMGRVKFTMQPDAANQNDFMISWPAIDCNRDNYPLIEDPQGTYTPKPVHFVFKHMLAQVRLFAYIRGTDRMVYQDNNADGIPDPADATWFDSWSIEGTIMDQYGNVYTKKGENAVERTTQKAAFPTEFAADLTKEEFVALGLKVPDESLCERWERVVDDNGSIPVWDKNHTRRRAKIMYKMEFNNIKTTTTFYPNYSGGSAGIAYEDATTLGSATVNDYIMNPYWFHFNDAGERDYLSDDYMFGFFEDTEAYDPAGENNALNYILGEKNQLAGDASKHFNYPPHDVLLVVPQKLSDDDVPHIVLTAVGHKSGDATTDYTARITINMLKMNIEWKSGFIYCYAILDELRPGDDIVRGPESITTIFDTDQYTDQW